MYESDMIQFVFFKDRSGWSVETQLFGVCVVEKSIVQYWKQRDQLGSCCETPSVKCSGWPG